MLTALVVAFLPAAVVGVALERPIKDELLAPGPVIAAWIVGGVVLIAMSRLREYARNGSRIETITVTQGFVIGAAQVLALWPGTSRSLVTIVAAVIVGLDIVAAVEFSFLLGLVTLGAATAFEAVRHGSELVDAFGILDPLIGFAVAFVSAVVAVRWMITYLERHSLAIFGWYRLVVAGIALVLLSAGVI